MVAAGETCSTAECGRACGLKRISGAFRSRIGSAAGKAAVGAAAVGDGRPPIRGSRGDAAPARGHGKVAIISCQEEISGEVAMLCDKYKEKLIEAAVRGAAMPPSLRDHVNVCAHCRQTFAAQRTILSAIDIELKEIANAEVPRSFDTRVTANLPVEKMPVYSRIPTWGLVPAAGILIVAVTLLVVPHYREKQIAAESMGAGKVAPDVLGERGNRPILGRNTAHHSNVSKLHIQRNVSTD